ncbi:unnamed protein product [Rotaria socialis]
MKEGNNIWSHVRNLFRPYTPSFQGLTTKTEIIRDNQKIANRLAKYYKKHFSEPEYDNKNLFHIECIEAYKRIEETASIALGQIKFDEVRMYWQNLKAKKSLDSTDTSALLLKNLPHEYLNIITTLFNKCAEAGEFFEKGKIAKGICLSKEGSFPNENRLRSISLLPNLAKIFEKIIAERIEKWCKEQGVYVDEQSGFTESRRLQTRIVAMMEDLKLTIAASNRPALTIFVDFATAFDRMWYPALMKSLEKLDMPLELRKWVFNWLQNRKMYISHGDAKSRIFNISVGAPQGSVLAALLFRLHVFFLPSYFPQITCHLFADDLTMTINGAIERKLTDNLIYVQDQAKVVLKSLEKFADDHILPVNIEKTKAMLIHSAVKVEKPEIFYKNHKIEYVKFFKCLGVEIGTKLGLGKHIDNRLKKVKTSYVVLRKIYKTLPKDEVKIRKKLFCAYSLPHITWLLSTWFHFTDKQKQKIEHVYGTGLRLVYSLFGYEDFTTLCLSRELALRDHVYKYWIRFQKHLDESPEAESYRQTWTAFLIATDPSKKYYKSLGLRKNSKFGNRLYKRAGHTYLDFISFKNAHSGQFCFFKNTSSLLEHFVLKHFPVVSL